MYEFAIDIESKIEKMNMINQFTATGTASNKQISNQISHNDLQVDTGSIFLESTDPGSPVTYGLEQCNKLQKLIQLGQSEFMWELY